MISRIFTSFIKTGFQIVHQTKNGIFDQFTSASLPMLVHFDTQKELVRFIQQKMKIYKSEFLQMAHGENLHYVCYIK